MEEVKALLGKTRLLTLTGSGGCGKTRLMLQVAADMLDAYADGVRLVELAPLAAPALVPQTVASVLGLREAPGKCLTETATDFLRSRQLLLLLDNCEHLLDACAQLADTLLRSCPSLRVLATSREGLGIAGELTYRVPSLSLPNPKRDPTPESLSQFEATRLFIERAWFHQPQFSVTHRNAPALASVCHRLDGIPLAIELAAARVQAMPVEQIEQRLDQRFRLLTGGSRTALPRQQTLRSLIDWSYDLLNESEKALLCRLTVFVGGWELEAAEQVCAGGLVEEWEVLDLLTRLVEKSLVVYEEDEEGHGRYRLLDTVRQYTGERLRESSAEETWRQRHAAWYLDLAERQPSTFRGLRSPAWQLLMETEHDNFRAALDWGMHGEPDLALRLAEHLVTFWDDAGYVTEGYAWLLQALDAGRDGDPALRARVGSRAGWLAMFQGDYPAAQAILEEALAILREAGDESAEWSPLNALGQVLSAQGDYSGARAVLEESVSLQRRSGDPHRLAAALQDLSSVIAMQGDYPAARVLCDEALAIDRSTGDSPRLAWTLLRAAHVPRWVGDYSIARIRYEEALNLFEEQGESRGIAHTHLNLGHLAPFDGDHSGARAHYQQALDRFGQREEKEGIALSLEGFGMLAAAEGRAVRAGRLFGAAEAIREAIRVQKAPPDLPPYEHAIAAARAALGEEAFETAWAEGRAMNLEHAIAYALENDQP
jgi:non-specific serine/threonine protein kinase